jgi:integrase
MAVGKITKSAVDRLEPGERIADSAIRGFIVRRLDSGAASYAYRYRVKGTNQQRLISLGIHGTITADRARELAKKRAGEVADGKDPKGEREESRAEAKLAKVAETNTVDAILDKFEARYSSKLRSGDQIKDTFERLVRPRIGSKSIYDGPNGLKRRDIVEMLDEIEDEHGPVMADRVLAHVRKAFNWWMVQDEDFNSPIVRGMARTKPKERRRKRTLTDEEIRDVWAALDQLEAAPACYPAYVRNLLLTMTRRNESSRMHLTELDGDVWKIPADRYKSKHDHVIPLSAMAIENLKTAPPAAKGQNSYFLFSTATTNRPMGTTAFSGFSKAKAELDRQIAKARKAAGKPTMPRWTLHDLRRTARSLMSRANIPDEHIERAIGHAIPGVRGVYDCYEYLDEKRKAFEALAQLVGMILNPPAGNVVKLERAAQ